MRNALKAEVPAGLNRELLVPGIQSSAPPGDVAIAVARLLAIAVDELKRHRTIAATTAERVPEYRSWPMVETPPRTGVGAVRYYVCPKGVLASAEEFFPVGTQFVMETSGDRRMEVFVMKKYAALYLSEHAAQDREVWMSTHCPVESVRLPRRPALSANR